jgi:dienelactone hydrolase
MSKEETKYADIKQRDEYIKSVEKFVAGFGAKVENSRRNRTIDKEALRKQFIDMLGYPLNCYEGYKKEAVKIKTEPLEDKDGGNMIMTRYQLEIMPDFWFSGVLYEPEDTGESAGKNALVIAQHGGGGTPELIGSLEHDSANYNHMVKRVIRKGITVFAPQLLIWDPAYFGNAGYNRTNTDQQLRQLGGSIAALEIFCIMRSIDYFTGLDHIDENRVGMMGLSYGGMYTLYTAAADTRIKAALSSCWCGDRLEKIWAEQNTIWTDWMFFDQYNICACEEIGSLILPRKLYVEIGKGDPLMTPENAEPYLRRLAEYAEKENCADSLKTKVFDGVHEVDRSDDGINFFVGNLLNI